MREKFQAGGKIHLRRSITQESTYLAARTVQRFSVSGWIQMYSIQRKKELCELWGGPLGSLFRPSCGRQVRVAPITDAGPPKGSHAGRPNQTAQEPQSRRRELLSATIVNIRAMQRRSKRSDDAYIASIRWVQKE